MYFSQVNARITGNLTKDPEVTTAASGLTIARFTVVVNKRIKRGENNYEDKAVFFSVAAFGKTAEHCQKHLQKGQRVALDVDIDSSEYEGRMRYDFIVRDFCPGVLPMSARSSGSSSGSNYGIPG